MKYLLLLLTTLFFIQINAQTPLSGVINSYASVLELDPCTGEVTVDDVSGFPIGIRLVIIQMQGASISEADNSNFGSITNIGGAGFHEINEVADINGNVITLSYKLINQYDVAGKVQLVKMPVYDEAEIVADLIPMPWDGNKGGVVALEVENTLTMNSSINANGSGFRGGAISVLPNDCNFAINNDNYFYDTGNWRSSAKGEGIADFIVDKEWGRGPQANGGGGGNDHNAGGGGGGNLVSGGQGGERNPDGFFGCDGEYPGLGGITFSALSNRAFMGGGGGAGHTNNEGGGSAGGNGGGIVLLKASTIISNNNEISVNGTFFDTTAEGAGGGGAGGTVIIESNTVLDVLNINLQGGKGGNTTASNASCNGPGGGGSGGRVLTNMPASLNINLLGGAAGINNNANALCNGESNGATSGTNGALDIIAFIATGNELIITPSITVQPVEEIMICEENQFELSVNADGSDLFYLWQLDMGTGFENLGVSSAYSGETTSTLTVFNPLMNMTGWQFRVVVTSLCGDILTSEITNLTVTPAPLAGFTFNNTGGLEYTFTDTSSGALGTVSWVIGMESINTTPDDTDPIVYTFPGPGSYEVVQFVSNTCGTEVFMETITIGVAPTAVFSAENTEGCPTLNVGFHNESLGAPTMLEWQFPGGLPNTLINDPNPIIMYPVSGEYDVIFIVTNEFGSDTLTQTTFINVLSVPTASFIPTSQGNGVVGFTNNSVDGTSFIWDFGDMSPISMESSTEHEYAESGVYEVTLTATNDCGSSSITQSVASGGAPQASFLSSQNSGCATFTTQFTDNSSSNPNEWFWQFPGGIPENSTEQNPVVVYDTPGQFPVSLQVTNMFGTTISTAESYINVQSFPSPSFNVEVDGFNVTFTNTTPATDNVNTFVWDYGNGGSSNDSNEQNPSFSFNQPGTYLVTLNALNSSCGAGYSEWVSILPSSLEEVDILPMVQVFPNPFTNQLFVEFMEMPNKPVELRLLGIDGKLYSKQTLDNQSNTAFETSYLPSGVYLIQMIYEREIFSVKLVK